MLAPLWYIESGNILTVVVAQSISLNQVGEYGWIWSKTVVDFALDLSFRLTKTISTVDTAARHNRTFGEPLRCLHRL